MGYEIPSEGYCDQPFVVVRADGAWVCTMTTGAGHEGQSGQHVVSCISHDQGKHWQGPYAIEPAEGPEASWAMPLLIPETGRIYAFYTYNSDNLRSVRTVDGNEIDRVDSLGAYAYKFSDDGGETWSADRYEIPMRLFACDRENTYHGKTLFFWGVGKPFLRHNAAYVVASKVGGFGHGFFVQNEGVLFRSPNLAIDPDPAKHIWETLPDGEIGLRTPKGGGPIAGEFNATPMLNGSLYGTYRTIDGYACHAISHDDGHTWTCDWMRFSPNGRKIKNPRGPNFVRRFSNGNYLYWFYFHGGEPLAQHPDAAGFEGYKGRNPAWLCGGVERDGTIHWSQPEIVLYDDTITDRMGYPDFIEQDGRYFLTETQKEIARVHELDPTLLEGMWRQGEEKSISRNKLLLEHDGTPGTAPLPPLPRLDGAPAEVDTTTSNRQIVPMRGGITLETCVRFDDLTPGQILFDSRNAELRGICLELTEHASLRLSLGGRDATGKAIDFAWETDSGSISAARSHHVVFIIDGGPKIVTVLVDGILCDGGTERQYGWGRFPAALSDLNGGQTSAIAPTLQGLVQALRVYARALRTSEAVAHFHAQVPS